MVYDRAEGIAKAYFFKRGHLSSSSRRGKQAYSHWMGQGDGESFIRYHIGEAYSEGKKFIEEHPPEQDSERRQKILEFMREYLFLLYEAHAKPVGRPKKKEPQFKGLINNAMFKGYEEREVRQRIALKEARRLIVAHAAGAKLGAVAKFGKTTMVPLQSLDETRAFAQKYYKEDEAYRALSDSKVVSTFIKEYQFPPEWRARLKMYLSRNRHKVFRLIKGLPKG